MLVTKDCLNCGAGFVCARWASKRRKFCSIACARSGAHNPAWKGGVSDSADGYREVNATAMTGGRRLREHVLIAEGALGKRLPARAIVHHFNSDRADNRNRNLVICQDQAYHMLLHALQRVLEAGGNPHTEKICHKCRAVKSKADFSPTTSRGRRVLASKCKPCAAAWQRANRAETQNNVHRA